MIIVKFESSSVWTEKSSTLFLTVFNSGPEDLYCTSEEYEPSGANPYILISSLRIVPDVGDTPEALAYEFGDMKFQVEGQEDLSEEGAENRFSPWACVSGDGYVSVRSLDGAARLPKKKSLRIQMDISGENIREGMGLLSYVFRDWRTYGADKKKLGEQKELGQQLWITKVSMPSITFKPKNESYLYGGNEEVSWSVTEVREGMGEYSVAVNGRDMGDALKGSCSLFMEDMPHVLELRFHMTNLTLRKKYWPIWFCMQKMPRPESRIPDEEGKVTFWWNVTEAPKCRFQGVERDAPNHTEVWSVSDGRTDFSLRYYDEDNFEKTFPESGPVSYMKPCVDEFKHARGNGIRQAGDKMSDFIAPEEAAGMDAVVNDVYGGDDPRSPSIPPTVYISLYIRGDCTGENCYISVNKGKIQTLKKSKLKEWAVISVKEADHYMLEIWDDYGCKVKKEL